MQLKWQFSLWCLLANISFKDFSPCCKMWKYEKTTNNWVFCIFTQNSQLLQICSENCPKSYLIQNINRSNGKHGGYFHFRQWRGGEVLILHFYLWSKFFSTKSKCLFLYKSTQIRITKLSVKQTCLSKACVDPSMKWDIFQIKQTCWIPLKLFKTPMKLDFILCQGALRVPALVSSPLMDYSNWGMR